MRAHYDAALEDEASRKQTEQRERHTDPRKRSPEKRNAHDDAQLGNNFARGHHTTRLDSTRVPRKQASICAHHHHHDSPPPSSTRRRSVSWSDRSALRQSSFDRIQAKSVRPAEEVRLLIRLGWGLPGLTIGARISQPGPGSGDLGTILLGASVGLGCVKDGEYTAQGCFGSI